MRKRDPATPFWSRTALLKSGRPSSEGFGSGSPTITGGSEPASDPAFSPDGTRVAFAMNGRLAVVAVATAEARVLTLGVDCANPYAAEH